MASPGISFLFPVRGRVEVGKGWGGKREMIAIFHPNWLALKSAYVVSARSRQVSREPRRLGGDSWQIGWIVNSCFFLLPAVKRWWLIEISNCRMLFTLGFLEERIGLGWYFNETEPFNETELGWQQFSRVSIKFFNPIAKSASTKYKCSNSWDLGLIG